MLDPIEEIKTRLDLVDLIREYIQVQAAGANFKARCPFHQEKSASFMISPSKQIWHCFGCQEGGDHFSFVMKQEGMEFGEAIRVLAQKAGVPLEQQDPRLKTQKNRFLDVLDCATQFYHLGFLRSPKAASARTYVESRGLDAACIDEFKIGYAPGDGSLLYQYLLSKKFQAGEMSSVGLIIKKEQGYQYHDRFRNRLMIPIRDVHGQVVGFGGRVLEDTANAPKYLNSPQTQLYDKSRIVFGLDKAKHEIRKADAVILVEGYMDFFALYQAGVRNVVATSGTALTQDHIRLLKRFTSHFLFSFDMDAAGGNATIRGIEGVLREGMDVRIIQLPRDEKGKPLYKDPDECIRKNSDDWHASVKNAQSFVQFHFDRTVTSAALSDGYAKKQAVRHMLGIIKLLSDRIEQDHWVKTLAKTLFLSENLLWEELSGEMKKIQPGLKISETSPSPTRNENTQNPLHMILFSFLVLYPTHQGRITNIVDASMFDDSQARDMYEKIIRQEKEEEFKKTLDLLILYSEKEFGECSEQEAIESACAVAEKIRNEYIKRRIQTLQHMMIDAEQRNDKVAVEEYAREFSQLYPDKNHSQKK